jgi:cytoplasmic iron level regulating protein YaaA (DUF328/UPF0246 family)
VLILLPPSEGKAPGGSGPPLDIDALSWPDLAPTRRRVLKALVAVSGRNPARARALLGLSEALDADRAANAVADVSPTISAGHRYAGVLHDALGYPTLRAAARRRADASVIVFSGLWGAVRPTDALPAYRIGIATKLPRVGPLPTLWRSPLLAALDEEIADAGAIDLRSSGYALMYRPSREAASKVIAVTVTGPDGTRAAPSYQSKVAKGRLTRALLERGTITADDLPEAAQSIGLTAEQAPNGLVVKAPTGWGLINPPLT